MKRNSRLSLALHTLGHMAGDPERMLTSADIARHAGTNPVVVRRVLGKLRDAQLLSSEKGHAGGWRLALSPHRITLADVYLALDETLIATQDDASASDCSVENVLRNKVAAVMREIEHDLVERLAGTTIMELSDTKAAGNPLD